MTFSGHSVHTQYSEVAQSILVFCLRFNIILYIYVYRERETHTHTKKIYIYILSVRGLSEMFYCYGLKAYRCFSFCSSELFIIVLLLNVIYRYTLHSYENNERFLGRTAALVFAFLSRKSERERERGGFGFI